MTAEEVARRAMAIAAEICVYTNNELTLERLDDA
jgi:ATP-dependent HslUV protease subunit HslV